MSSSHAGQVIEKNEKTPNNKQSTDDSDHERIERDVLERETCEQLTETFSELPDLNLSDFVFINEDDVEVQHNHSQPYSEATPTRSIAEKQKVQRIARYSKRTGSRDVK